MKRWTISFFLSIHTAPYIPSLASFITPCSTTATTQRTIASYHPIFSQHRDAKSIRFVTQQSSSNENDSLEENNSHPNHQEQPQQISRQSINKQRKSSKEASESRDLLFQRQSIDPFRADFRDASEPKLMTTFGGGTALMFEMIAKRMLDWGNEAKPFNPEDDSFSTTNGLGQKNNQAMDDDKSIFSDVLPRWHPHSGISDVNPNFRYQAPAMNNQGFAKSIWRNVRKRNKPSLWRHALRTYDRMTQLEDDPNHNNKIQRTNTHHEGAMLACAKLGLWQRALEIYHHVYQVEQEWQEQFDKTQKRLLVNPTRKKRSSTTTTQPPVPRPSRPRSRIRRNVHVTDSMITSLIQSCVVASRQRSRNKGTHQLSPAQEEQEAALRRIPLDTAVEVLTTIQGTHNIPLVARHVNPLAAAYQSLGYISQATEILLTMLSNRTAGEEPEDGVDILNVYDLCARDKGSYSLLVQGAVVAGDWGAAVDALSDMTAAGLYPKQRHCNLWSEISERKTRPRATGSWKKKRDDYWAESVR